MKHPEYFTQEEREILEDYFIHHGPSSKNNFLKFKLEKMQFYGHISEELASNYPLKTNDPIDIVTNKNMHLWHLDLSEVKWMENSGNNLVSYLMEKMDTISKTRLKDLKTLCKNWGHINHQGQTILHILAQKRNDVFFELFEDHKTLNIDVDKKDNESKYFTYYLFDNLVPCKENSLAAFRRFQYLEQVVHLTINHPNHFILMDEGSIKNLIKKINKEEELLITIAKKINESSKSNNIFDAHMVDMPAELNTTLKPMRALLESVMLDKKLSKNNMTKKTKKI